MAKHYEAGGERRRGGGSREGGKGKGVGKGVKGKGTGNGMRQCTGRLPASVKLHSHAHRSIHTAQHKPNTKAAAQKQQSHAARLATNACRTLRQKLHKHQSGSLTPAHICRALLCPAHTQHGVKTTVVFFIDQS